MKFQFKIQPFQTKAVENIVRVFSGQPKQDGISYRRDMGKAPVLPAGTQTTLFPHFIELTQGFTAENIDTNNRKRIAMACVITIPSNQGERN